jgi:hypothetical protein
MADVNTYDFPEGRLTAAPTESNPSNPVYGSPTPLFSVSVFQLAFWTLSFPLRILTYLALAVSAFIAGISLFVDCVKRYWHRKQYFSVRNIGIRTIWGSTRTDWHSLTGFDRSRAIKTPFPTFPLPNPHPSPTIMFPRILFYLSLILGCFFTTALSAAFSYAQWSIAVFQYRCKAPNIVEAYCQDWKEWRVSSICVPGTCCATRAVTGPLCTAEACEKAELEREQKLKSYNAIQASKKQMSEAQKARESQSKSKMSDEAEKKWKIADDRAEAERLKALAEIRFEA